MQRIDGRDYNELRKIDVIKDYVIYPEGSVLISAGNTKLICNVTIEETVPPWIMASGKQHGWITGEYSMLPRATESRTRRETNGPKGRTQEIQRLVGRALRSVVNLELLGQRTCIIDCDVLQADGGTRTTAITGGYIALRIALEKLIEQGILPVEVFSSQIAAISVGIVKGQALLDLCYAEDSQADTDLNVVMNTAGQFIEIQGTAENEAFTRQELENMLNLADNGIRNIFDLQNSVLNN